MRRRAGMVVAAVLLAACRPEPPPPPEGEVVIDFTEGPRRWAASAETGWIDLGEAGADERLAGGWSIPERDGERSYQWSDGPESALAVEVLRPRALPIALWMLPYPEADGSARRRVTVSVNGTEVATLEPGPEWERYDVATPARLWRSGANEIRFRYSRTTVPGGGDDRELAVAFDRVVVGPGASDVVAPAEGEWRLPALGQAEFFFEVPPGARIDVGSVEPWSLEGSAGVALRLEIDYRPEGGSVRRLFEGLPGGALALPLGAPAGEIGRLTFRAWAEPEGGPTALLRKWLPAWSDPAPVLAGLALRDAALRGEPASGEAPTLSPVPPERSARRPPVFVYLVDTLRADELGCYGGPAGVSPRIDAFAADAVRFTEPVLSTSWTRASVASFFTGLHPHAHGARRRRNRLEEHHQTVAELLGELGYATAGFTVNGNVAPVFGFGQGFDVYRALPERDDEHVHALSDELNAAALPWLDEPREGPPFLYLHSADPHSPYTPEESWASRFAPGADRALGRIEVVRELGARPVAEQHAMADDLRALYRAEVAFNDAAFGAFVDRLKALGLYEPAAVFLVSDHGEEFLDHGRWQHGQTLYREQLRVPFLMKLPGNRGAGTTSDAPVQLEDVLPTILDLAGAPAPDGLDGRSLLPLAEGDGRAFRDRLVASNLELDIFERNAVVLRGRKLIATREPKGRLELYDLAADPGEKTNLAPRRPVETGYLRTLLDGFRDRRRGEAGEDAEIPPELEERLRALGYLQ